MPLLNGISWGAVLHEAFTDLFVFTIQTASVENPSTRLERSLSMHHRRLARLLFRGVRNRFMKNATKELTESRPLDQKAQILWQGAVLNRLSSTENFMCWNGSFVGDGSPAAGVNLGHRWYKCVPAPARQPKGRLSYITTCFVLCDLQYIGRSIFGEGVLLYHIWFVSFQHPPHLWPDLGRLSGVNTVVGAAGPGSTEMAYLKP